MSLNSTSIAKLVAFVPSLTTWIWQKNPKDAADVLATLGPRRMANRETTAALQLLLSLPPMSTLSTSQLRESLSYFPHEIWHRVLFIIVSNPKAPLISRSCYSGLLELKEGFKSNVASENLDEDFLEEVWMIVERLPTDSFRAFADICTLLRETSTNPGSVSKLLGPRILLPDGHQSIVFKHLSADKSGARTSKTSSSTGMTSEAQRKAIISEEEIQDAAELFEFMVLRSEEIFFQYGANVPAIGYRDQLFTPTNADHSKKHERIRQLQQFYKLVDEKYVRIAEKLFDTYTFPQIAEAIWTQYFFVPEHWKEELMAHMLASQDDPHMRWFENNESAITELTFRNIATYQAIDKSFAPVEKDGPSRVVEEVLSTEKNYSLRMRNFMNTYVRDVRDISMGGKGEKAKKKLGLSDKEVHQIFGKRFSDVVDSVESFLVELEVLRLIRAPVLRNPVTGVSTRAGVLAQIILEHGTKLVSDYKEYNSIQRENVSLIAAAGERVKSEKKDGKLKNFMDLWTDLSDQFPDLRGVTIERILLLPSKRFSDYKLMLERMHKYIQKEESPSEPDLDVINRAMRLCDKVCGGLNDAIRTNSKAARVLGKNI